MDQDPITGEDIDIYYPVGVWADPVDVDNNYRYKGFRNGLPMNDPEEMILLDDKFVNGADSLPHHMPELRFSRGDQIKLELHSLSKESYDFLRLLKSQTTSLGSSTGTSPAILRGNLANIEDEEEVILGYFGASAVSADSILIE